MGKIPSHKLVVNNDRGHENLQYHGLVLQQWCDKPSRKYHASLSQFYSDLIIDWLVTY